MADDAGPLILIGGHEDKDGEREILRIIADGLRGGPLVIATIASHAREGYFESYCKAFDTLGVTDLVELYVKDRAEAMDGATSALLEKAAGVFFTGGDQLRIVSQIGDTPLEAKVHDLHRRGGVIAGTSAGASAQGETMLVTGAGQESYRIGDLHMAPGLGLIPGVMIDQHFAERGRIGRLLGAVAHNPRLLGIGVDEDTAIVVRGEDFEVIGAGGVTIVDAARLSHSNIAETKPESVLSMHDVTLHVLSAGDRFNLLSRRPAQHDASD